MRLAFIADSRSEHARNWLKYFVGVGDEVILLSTFPGPVIPGVKTYVLPGLFRVGGSLTNDARDSSPKPKSGTARILRFLLSSGFGKLLYPAWQQFKVLDLWSQVRSARGVLSGFRPDLVHAFRIQNEGYVGAWAKYHPLVVSSWGSDLAYIAGKYPIHRFLTRLSVNKPDAFTADCKRDIRLAREFGLPAAAPARCFPGNGGIDRSMFHPASSASPKRERVILYTREYSPFSRLDTLLEAFRIVLSRQPGQLTKLVLLVPREVIPIIESMRMKLGLSSTCVQVRSSVSHEEMIQLLQTAAVSVSPMESDGTPVSMLEAMACGAFPVMSDLESIREWITHGENGLLFNPGEPEELAACLEEALGNTRLRQAAQILNAQIIADRADYSKVMPQVREFYQTLIAPKPVHGQDPLQSQKLYSFEIVPPEKINKHEYCSATGKSVFTTIPWVDFVSDDSKVKPLIIRITENGEFAAYFTGLITKKYGIRILGSPFRGWSTCFMGFDSEAYDKSVKILPELVRFIFTNTDCHYFECVDRNIPLSDRGQIPFSTRVVDTLELQIAKSDEDLLSGFKGDCRNFIKQFEKRGAVIEIAEPNESFAEEYYAQLRDVFAKQRLVPTYGVEKVKKLVSHLGKTDMLLCLRVRAPDGRSIATSIFLGYKNKFFFWGGASYKEFQKYRPNEYMIWHAIRYWRERGVKTFDMVGVRDYKLKFGAEKKEYLSIMAAKYPGLIYLRDLAEKVFFKVLKLKGSRLSSPSASVKYGNLTINEVMDMEIAHYSDEKVKIFSKFNAVFVQIPGKGPIRINLPVNYVQRILGGSRLLRRFLRLDKSCVIPTDTGYVIFWQGNVYHVKHNEDIPVHTLKMTGCRNPLHNSVSNTDGKNLYFGEYGNPDPDGKSIYHSPDGGQTWRKVFNFPNGKIRHIHACKWDPYEEKVWVFTGDADGEAHILCADKAFRNIEWIGDGSQTYRTVDAFFERDSVHWIMDSPLAEVRHIKLDRGTRKVSAGQVFPGPVWYLKRLSDGLMLACTVQEEGPSHKDRKVHLYASRNLSKWVEVAQFEHDGFKKGLMKFGVAGFADGPQSSDAFYMHFEAIRKLDGKVCLCSLGGL